MDEQIKKVLIIGFTEEWNGTERIPDIQKEIDVILDRYNLLYSYQDIPAMEYNIRYQDEDNSDNIEGFYEYCIDDFEDEMSLKFKI